MSTHEEIRKEYNELCAMVGDFVFQKADVEAKLKAIVDVLADASKRRVDLQKQLETANVPNVQGTVSES